MKRALTIAVAAALFATLFSTVALAAGSSSTLAASAATVSADDGSDIDVGPILRRCRLMFGEDQLTDMTKERCLELWKRWCNSHPHARVSRRFDVPPHEFRVTQRVLDRRCRPDLPTDRPIDRPADRPADRPVDRPSDRPVDRPSERPVIGPEGPEDRPVVGPPETADLDRVRDRDYTNSDKEGNDIHFRARRADL